MKIGRNEPCPCGSGKKYKVCCERAKAEGKGDWSRNALYVIAAILVVGLAGMVYGMTRTPEDGRVWSAEHGHWHNADGTEIGSAPGRVWSEEHGHWHNADGTEIGAAPGAAGPRYVPQPPGEAPEGLVWSTEHGHWHDAVTGMEPTN